MVCPAVPRAGGAAVATRSASAATDLPPLSKVVPSVAHAASASSAPRSVSASSRVPVRPPDWPRKCIVGARRSAVQGAPGFHIRPLAYGVAISVCVYAPRARQREPAVGRRAPVAGSALHARRTPLRAAAQGRDALLVEDVGDRLQGHPLLAHARDPGVQLGHVGDRQPALAAAARARRLHPVARAAPRSARARRLPTPATASAASRPSGVDVSMPRSSATSTRVSSMNQRSSGESDATLGERSPSRVTTSVSASPSAICASAHCSDGRARWSPGRGDVVHHVPEDHGVRRAPRGDLALLRRELLGRGVTRSQHVPQRAAGVGRRGPDLDRRRRGCRRAAPEEVACRLTPWSAAWNRYVSCSCHGGALRRSVRQAALASPGLDARAAEVGYAAPGSADNWSVRVLTGWRVYAH